jgi:signal transduction histidine kinase
VLRWALFDAWVRDLDPGLRRETVSLGAFAAASAMAVALMAGLSFLPGAAGYFAFDFWAGVRLFLPQLGLGVLVALAERRGRLSLRAFGLVSLVGAGLFQLWMWSLVVLAAGRGAMVLGALPLLLVSFHGYLYRSSLAAPYSLASSLVALLLISPLARTEQHALILGILGPIALATHLLLGGFARASARAERERGALRAAIDAQIVSEQVMARERIEALLLELRGRSHDAGNAVAGPLLTMPHLVRLLDAPLDEQERQGARRMAEAVTRSLERLRELLAESLSLARDTAPAAERVHAGGILGEVVREFRAEHPGAEVELLVAPELSGLELALRGGAGALARVTDNLLRNALEGDGHARARHVMARLGRATDGQAVELVVEDDGPGFPAELLGSPLEQLRTTKAHGGGLGLYTTARVLAASGGSLARENRAEGGARVTVRLPAPAGAL